MRSYLCSALFLFLTATAAGAKNLPTIEFPSADPFKQVPRMAREQNRFRISQVLNSKIESELRELSLQNLITNFETATLIRQLLNDQALLVSKETISKNVSAGMLLFLAKRAVERVDLTELQKISAMLGNPDEVVQEMAVRRLYDGIQLFSKSEIDLRFPLESDSTLKSMLATEVATRLFLIEQRADGIQPLFKQMIEQLPSEHAKISAHRYLGEFEIVMRARPTKKSILKSESFRALPVSEPNQIFSLSN